MKKVLKIAIILIMFLAIIGQTTYVHATGTWSAYSDAQWDPRKQDIDTTDIESRAGIILSAIRNIGIVVSVLALMIIGIRSMVGSVEEKSAYKQALPGYVLGAILAMAITTLPSIIYSIAFKWNNI